MTIMRNLKTGHCRVLKKNYKIKRAKETIAMAKTPLGRVVRRIQKKVRKLNPELKYIDVNYDSALPVLNNISATDSRMDILPNITQGPGDYGNRIGDKICLKSLNIRGQLVLGTAYSFQPVRVLIWAPRSNPDGANSYLSMANEYITSALDNTNMAPFVMKDWDNKSAFVTLYDRMYMLRSTVSVGNAGTVHPTVIPFRIKLNLKSRIAQYFGGGPSLVKNQIFVTFLSSIDNAVTFNAYARLTYTDV